MERALLDRARDAEVARRRDYYARLELVAELDRAAVAEATGDRGTVRLLQAQWNVDHGEAKRLLDEAGDLLPRRSLQGERLPARFPCTSAAVAAGAIGPGHVVVIRRTMARLERISDLSVEDWVEADRFLAEKARQMSPAGLTALAKALVAHLDPDGEAPPEGEERCDELHVVRRRDGRLDFKGSLHDPADAEVFLGTIDPLAEKLGPEDTRSLERRRADALKEVVENADPADRDAADDSAADRDAADDDAGEFVLIPESRHPEPRRPEPAAKPTRPSGPSRSGRVLLTLTMDHRWLQQAVGHGVLDSGALVHAQTVRRLACDAGVIPMVLGSRSEPLDVGRRQRTAPEAIRRALHLRDGGCAFPGCTRPPRRCQAHHVDHWLDGGDTCVENMCLLCRFHHQLVHHGHWTITMIDGRPWFTPPDWIDPDRQPRPGGRARSPVAASAWPPSDGGNRTAGLPCPGASPARGSQ
ncbi:HNH endonuclease signature motif containing protein [Actinomycetospora chlora]|uniref:HNH endonuclease signature motif containing protein n=1 Tax=Actinomycetospora chlora TaxID=663608 RepID=UPI0031EC896D